MVNIAFNLVFIIFLRSNFGTDIDTYVNSQLFSSTCPGWICYAEKTYPDALPAISTTKSAQQITGTVLKHLIAPMLSKSDPAWSKVYHVAIMPCFDKKLEASRKVGWEQFTSISAS